MTPHGPLSDEERFVLREVRDAYADVDDVRCNEIAAVIDGLLARQDGQAAVIDSLRREVRLQRQEIAALREERRALLDADSAPELGSVDETR